MMKSVLFVLIMAFCGLTGRVNAAEAVVFSKSTIRVGGKTLNVEIADSYEEHERGLMFRHELADGAGMLFIFPDEMPRRFWMKNTFIPLSIGYFDAKRKLIDIQDMQPVKSEMQRDVPIYPSRGAAMYALEVPEGWFKRHGVKLGAILEILAPATNPKLDKGPAKTKGAPTP